MKYFHLLRRIIKSGFLNLFRNSWLTLAATIVMLVSLLIMQLAIVLNITADKATKQISKNLKAEIYLKDASTEVQAAQLVSDLKTIDIVEKVDYISKEQAQKEFADSSSNPEDLLKAYAIVGESVLPASIRVSVTDLSRIAEVGQKAQNSTYKDIVDKVSLGKVESKKTIDRAVSAQRFITVGSVISAGTLTVVSILIIFNTIRMAIYTRREEIRVMKLIGATPNYIRGPFVVESSLYGAFAGVMSTVVVYSLIYGLGSKVSSQVEFAATYRLFTDSGTMLLMGISAVLIGILIGVISCLLAMEKHLKLKTW
jgi:cell division transport system permease protein